VLSSTSDASHVNADLPNGALKPYLYEPLESYSVSSSDTSEDDDSLVIQNMKAFTQQIIIFSGFYRQHTSITDNHVALMELISFHLMSIKKYSNEEKVIMTLFLQAV